MRSSDDPDLTLPLLPSHLQPTSTPGPDQATPQQPPFKLARPINPRENIPLSPKSTTSPPRTPTPAHDGSHHHYLTTMRCLWAIIRPVRAVALLFCITTTQSLIGAQMGQIAGGYYKSFVDQDVAAFIALAWRSAILYVAISIAASGEDALVEWIALRWRVLLTTRIQTSYCNTYAFLWLPGSVDNPDQRITADVALFCTSMSKVARSVASAPLAIALYSVLTYRVFHSILPVAAAVLFFVTGALVQRMFATAVAAAVWKQEQLEGNFRTCHSRLRAQAAPIAQWRGAPAELHALHQPLSALAANQLGLVLRRWALGLITRTLDYSGAMVAYVCVAIAVFSGTWTSSSSGESGLERTGFASFFGFLRLHNGPDPSDGMTAGGFRAPSMTSPGDIASLVSNGTFFLLSLIYSFTCLLDLAAELSTTCALGARLGALLMSIENSDSAHDSNADLQSGTSSYLPLGTTAWSYPDSKSETVNLTPYESELVHENLIGADESNFGSNSQLPPRSTAPYESECKPENEYLIHTDTQSSSSSLLPWRSTAPYDSKHAHEYLLPADTQSGPSTHLPPKGSMGSNHDHKPASACLAADSYSTRHLTATDGSKGSGSGYEYLTAVDESKGLGYVNGSKGVGYENGSKGVGYVNGSRGVGSGSENLTEVNESKCGPSSYTPSGSVAPCGSEGSASENGSKGVGSENGCKHGDENLIAADDSRFGPRSHLPLSSITEQEHALIQLRDLTVWCPSNTQRSVPSVQSMTASTRMCDGQVTPWLRPSSTQRGVQSSSTVPNSDSHTAKLRSFELHADPATMQCESHTMQYGSHSSQYESHDSQYDVLIKGLDLSLGPCQRLLVSGPDACGKSTLAYCISGLWRHCSGLVQLAVPPSQIIVLPQTPVTAPGGSLREQLLYPGTVGLDVSEASRAAVASAAKLSTATLAGSCQAVKLSTDAEAGRTPVPAGLPSDAELEAVLRAVGLGCLLQTTRPVHMGNGIASVPPESPLDRRLDWSTALSPGQLQRLSVARALQAKPRVVVLDEATVALPEQDEVQLYRLLMRMGAALISMGHRTSLRELHTHELRIHADGEGSWSLTVLNDQTGSNK